MTGNDALTYVENALPPELPIRGFIGTLNYVQEMIRSGKTWSFDFATGTIDTIGVYSTGTIDVTNADATVSGTGTTFTSGMVGRKMRINGIPYTIATFTSTTEIELDRTYGGTTDTGLAYDIYQDEYALASDVVSLMRLWDVTNQRRLCASPTQLMGDRDFRHELSGDALYYSLFGRDSSSDQLLRFSPWPDSVDHYEYWYEKDYTRVTAIGDTIDIPSDMDFVIKQGCLARVGSQLGLDQAGAEMSSFQKLLGDSYMKDRPLMDIKVRLARNDRYYGYGHNHHHGAHSSQTISESS